MRCAKGIFAKGILGRTGFPLLQWEKGSETPSCDGVAQRIKRAWSNLVDRAFGSIFVNSSQEKLQNTGFTKCFSVRTPEIY